MLSEMQDKIILWTKVFSVLLSKYWSIWHYSPVLNIVLIKDSS